jgi:hypothetical protein
MVKSDVMEHAMVWRRGERLPVSSGNALYA